MQQGLEGHTDAPNAASHHRACRAAEHMSLLLGIRLDGHPACNATLTTSTTHPPTTKPTLTKPPHPCFAVLAPRYSSSTSACSQLHAFGPAMRAAGVAGVPASTGARPGRCLASLQQQMVLQPSQRCPNQQAPALADAWCVRQARWRSSADQRPVATRAFQQSAAGPSSYNASTAMQQPSMSGSQFSRSPPQPQHQEGGRVQLQQQPQQYQQQQQGQGGALVSSAEGSSSGGSSTALKAKEQPKMVQARFWLKFHVDYGQCIRIIGGHEATGAWNLAKAPFLRWSEGDLWNVTLELAAGGVYEYKYVVVESDGVTAASWQRGANNVLALQMTDTEVEVYDNWKNAPGALCVVDGQEITRERKLLAWAGDMSVQRSELRRTRMELAQAREEIRVLRAELSVLRMEVSEANIARAAAEARQMELERSNSQLRLEVATSQATSRSTMEEAVRLLNDLSSDSDSGEFDPYYGSTRASLDHADTPAAAASSSSYGGGEHDAATAAAGGGGGGMFGGLFGGFNKQQPPGSNGNGRVHSKVGDPLGAAAPGSSAAASGRAASVVAAAAAAMPAAHDPRRPGGSSSSMPYGGTGSSYSSNGGRSSRDGL